MKNIRIKNILLICISMLIFVVGCNKDVEDIVYNPDLVFANAFSIKISSYSYFEVSNDSDSTEYKIMGDQSSDIDTIGSMPEFQWLKSSSDIFTVAISDQSFTVKNNQIENADRILWQWHSGLPNSEIKTDSGTIVKVLYLKGKQTKNKNIYYDTQPFALESGLYYWAVWSWGNNANKVLFSSKELKFYVK